MKHDEVPFQLCTIAFTHLSSSTYIKGQNDTGYCLETLDQGCVDPLSEAASSAAGGTNDAANLCQMAMDALMIETPNECLRYGDWRNAASTSK